MTAQPQIDRSISRAPSARSRGFSPGRLERIHDVLRREVDAGRLPGAVGLVSRRGEEHVVAIGSLAFDHGAPMGRDTIFRLASNTKPITAVATMTLVEECRLRLDDPVDEWLPELANRRVLRSPGSPLDDTVPANRPITVRDLLTYRCGYGEVLALAAGSPIHRAFIEARLPLASWPFAGTPDDLMKRLGALPLASQPGERWLYHMSGEILGVLIARVSGKSLGSFLRERIFEPLGMKDTDFSVPESKLDRLPPCYCTDPSTGKTAVQDEPRTGIYARPPIFEGGAGGLVSTADDMLAFGRMMLLGGSKARERILSRTAVALMTTDHLTAEQKASSPFFPHFWETVGWGLGLGIITRRCDVGRSPGAFGWDGAFGTSCWIDPAEDLVGVLMIQRAPATLAYPAIIGDFWTSVYQAIDD
jgi:CubicO group peptidase (beta-lactamase class C family)